MNTQITPAVFVIISLFAGTVRAAEIKVTNDLDTVRTNEMVNVDGVGPGPLLVRDAGGREVTSQMVGDDSVVFQASFAARETKMFTVEKGKSVAGDPCAHALFIDHPGLDYKVWENDRIAYRLY